MTIHHPGGNTPQYPELATAVMTGPEDCGNVLRYTFSRAIGSKG
jgi:PRTRC genetic system protein C